jgi:hypothetical protein
MALDQVHGARQRAIYNFPDIATTVPAAASDEANTCSTWRLPSKHAQAKRIDALVTKGMAVDSPEVRRMVSCGRIIVVEHACGTREQRRLRCESPFCVRCAVTWSRRRQADVVEMFRGKNVRLITLTNGTVDSLDLPTALTKLTKAFGKMRRRLPWKKAVVRGVAGIHIRARPNDCFQPHLHIFVEGAYVPFAVLKQLWSEVAGDVGSVDVKAVKSDEDLERMARYVFRPDARCPGPEQLSPNQLYDLRFALKKRKTVIWFGKKPNQPAKATPSPCACCGKTTRWQWVESQVGPPPLLKYLVQQFHWPSAAGPPVPPENLDADPPEHAF